MCISMRSDNDLHSWIPQLGRVSISAGLINNLVKVQPLHYFDKNIYLLYVTCIMIHG